MQPVLDIRQDLDQALGHIDPHLLGQAAVEIRRELAYAHGLIKVAVHCGWVSLEGEVEWNYQRNGAETAVRRLSGVKGISNGIHVQPRAEPGDVESRIEAAFGHDAQHGVRIRSWAEGESREQAAEADSA